MIKSKTKIKGILKAVAVGFALVLASAFFPTNAVALAVDYTKDNIKNNNIIMTVDGNVSIVEGEEVIENANSSQVVRGDTFYIPVGEISIGTGASNQTHTIGTEIASELSTSLTQSKIEVSYANQVLQTIEGQDSSEGFSFDAKRLGTYKITYTVVYDQTIYSYDYIVECVAGEATFEFEANDKNIIPTIYDTEMAKQHENKDIVLPLPTVNDEDGNVILSSDDKEYYTLSRDGSDIASNDKNCFVYISVTNGADDIAITTNENGDYIIDGDSLIKHELDGRTFTITYTYYELRANGNRTLIASTNKSFTVEEGYYYTDSDKGTSGYDIQVSWSTSNRTSSVTVGVATELPTVTATTRSTNSPASEKIDVYYELVVMKRDDKGAYTEPVTDEVITEDGKFKAKREGSYQVTYNVYDFYGNQAKTTETNFIINATDTQQAYVYMYDAKTDSFDDESTTEDYEDANSKTEYKLKTRSKSNNIIMYAIKGNDNMIEESSLTLRREIVGGGATRFVVSQSQYNGYNLIFAPLSSKQQDGQSDADYEKAIYAQIAQDNYEIQKQMLKQNLDFTDGSAVKEYLKGAYLLVTQDGKNIFGDEIVEGGVSKDKRNDESVISAMINAGYAYVPYESSSSTVTTYEFRDGTEYTFRYVVDDNHSEKTERTLTYSVTVTTEEDQVAPSITFSSNLRSTYQRNETIEFDVATASDASDSRLEVVTAWRYLNGNNQPVASDQTTQTLQYVLSGSYNSSATGKWYVDVDGKNMMTSEGWYFDSTLDSYSIDLKDKPTSTNASENAEKVEILCYAIDDSGNIGFFQRIINIADATDDDMPEIIKIANAPENKNYSVEDDIILPTITYKDSRVDYMSADVVVYRITRDEDNNIISRDPAQSLNKSTKPDTMSQTFVVNAGKLNATVDGEYQVIVTVKDAGDHTVSTYFTYNVTGGTVVEDPTINNITSETIEVLPGEEYTLDIPTLSITDSTTYGYIGISEEDDSSTSTWYATTILSENGNNNGKYNLTNNTFIGETKGTYKLQYEVYLLQYNKTDMTTLGEGNKPVESNKLYLDENGNLKISNGAVDYFIIKVEDTDPDAKQAYKLMLSTSLDGITGSTAEISTISGLENMVELYVLHSKVQTISVQEVVLNISVDDEVYAQTQYPTIDKDDLKSIEIVRPDFQVKGEGEVDYEKSYVQISRTTGSSTTTLAQITLAEWEEHFVNDQSNSNFTSTNVGDNIDNNGTIQLVLKDNGTYNIKYSIQAVDYLGQKVGDPKTLEYSITNGDVKAPEIDLADDFISSTYNLGDTLRINMAGMSVSDDTTKDEDLLKSTIRVELENTDTDDSWDLDNEGNEEAGEYIFTHTLESAGDYTLTITITDEAGNKATKTVSFTVSTESADPVNVTEVLGGILIAVSVAALAGVVIYFIVSKVKLDKKEKRYKQDIDEK